MSAEIAFCGGIGLGIDIKGIIRAGLHARFAADAAQIIKVDYAVGTLIQRRGGADVDAGRLFAMVAAMDRKKPPIVGEGPFFDIFHMRPVDTQSNIVLRFAGHRTGVAADAGAVINGEAVVHFERLSLLSLTAPGVGNII